jgi:hypothetical protein
MKDIIPFHREAFEIIKDKFTLIEDLPTDSDYEIVSIYGATCENDGICDNPQIIFPFLRNLFLDNITNTNTQKKRIFITRKNCQINHIGILKRYICNENELMTMLRKYNFEYIQLEEYPMRDKIKLFMDSEIIISSFGSALTNLLFVDKTTKIVEISTGKYNHIAVLSNTFGLNFNRYYDVISDANELYTLNIMKFEEYLLANIILL